MASRVHKNVTFLFKNTKKTAKKSVQFSPCWIWCQNVPSVCVFVCLFVCLSGFCLKNIKKKKSQIAKLKHIKNEAKRIKKCRLTFFFKTLFFQKILLHFSIRACHPCAGTMLIFSVSYQFF